MSQAQDSNVSQKVRLAIFIAYVLLLIVLSFIALNQAPPLDERGMWFYSGLLAFLSGALIEAPFFTAPAQAFAWSLIASIGTFAIWYGSRENLDTISVATVTIVLIFEIVVLATSILTIFLKDVTIDSVRGRIGKTTYVVLRAIGRPEAIWSGPFLFGLLAFHRANAQEALALSLGWSILIFGRPIEKILGVGEKVRSVWTITQGTTHLGEVVGHSVPKLVTIRHPGPATVTPGTALIVPGDDGAPNVALALNYVGVADGLWLRALQLDLPKNLRQNISPTVVEGGLCARITASQILKDLEGSSQETLVRRADLVGLVAPGTDIRLLKFEVVRTDLEFEAGQLMEVSIGNRSVLFQVLNGLTREDILQQKNTRGYIVGEARKVGYWNTARRRFESVHWIPAPNTPVFLPAKSNSMTSSAAIGHFPETSYPIEINTSDLVTHNAAILGILGVGKTFLALELVERMMREDIRVICLDLTEQYIHELSPYVEHKRQQDAIDSLQKIGKEGRRRFAKNVEEGGSITDFSKKVRETVAGFLDPQKTYRLLVLNPNTFEVWRQDSKIYNNEASMASLTPSEITKIISEASLEAVQRQGMTDRARCCLVYEEAHSLVPEWNAIAYESDRAAANGTARAILQGRKFGLGCLVVTQRTASVTKTILNQCNTVFSFRTFDATGMEFLANYIGQDFTSILSSLRDRQAVVFGKASSCADPVLIRVNDRNDFLSHFRTQEDEPEEA